MAMLHSVLRLKQIHRLQNMQELARSNAELQRCNQQLSLAQQREESARNALWLSMTGEEALCVQRISLARAHEAMARAMREQAAAFREACARENDVLAANLARLEKEIEKLTERAERERLEQRDHVLKLQWHAIDEAVVNRVGAAE